MWYSIDFFLLAIQMLPTKLRTLSIASFTLPSIKPLGSLHYKWENYRADNIYKLTHTGQVCSLRKSLNDKFDQSERRIYIGEGNDFNTLYLYTEAENQDKYLGTFYLRSDAETDTDLDFIVYVPQEIYRIQIHGLNAHINFYKQAGRRYAIFITA